MIVLVPEAVDSRLLQGFPEGVEIAFLPKEGPLSEKALAAEFAVAPYGGARRFLPSFPT